MKTNIHRGIWQEATMSCWLMEETLRPSREDADILNRRSGAPNGGCRHAQPALVASTGGRRSRSSRKTDLGGIAMEREKCSRMIPTLQQMAQMTGYTAQRGASGIVDADFSERRGEAWQFTVTHRLLANHASQIAADTRVADDGVESSTQTQSGFLE